MRLPKALELIQSGEFSGLKHWPMGEATKVKDEILPYAADAAEFSLLAETDAGESLSTFQQFGFELWSAGLAKGIKFVFLAFLVRVATGARSPTDIPCCYVCRFTDGQGGRDGWNWYVRHGPCPAFQIGL